MDSSSFIVVNTPGFLGRLWHASRFGAASRAKSHAAGGKQGAWEGHRCAARQAGPLRERAPRGHAWPDRASATVVPGTIEAKPILCDLSSRLPSRHQKPVRVNDTSIRTAWAGLPIFDLCKLGV